MILVDDRIGSIELIPTLQSVAPVLCSAKDSQVPRVTSTRLVAGDVCFDGLGPANPLSIGIERKRLRDMLNSIRSGRYSGHQLPEMLSYYDHCYLIIEGFQRCGPDGELQTLTGHGWNPLTIGSQVFRFTELDHFICSIERFTPVKVRRTANEQETCAEILSLYTHFQKPYSKHHSHQALYNPQSVATIGKAGLVRRMSAQMSGIGWERSGQVALKFRTVKDMVDAGISEWQSIKPGFGKVLAKRAFDQLRGEYKDKGEL